MPILSIQSWVTTGHVGNAAAIFPLQRLGTEVWAIHTVQWSNHPGHFPPAGRVATAADIADIVAVLDRRGLLARCTAILSGYIGDPAIADAILDAVARTRAANPDALYCCDPVIGDAGRIYVRPEIPALVADRLLPEADIATPNQFELEHLTGSSLATLADALSALATLRARLRPHGPRAALLTSLALEPGTLDILSADRHGPARVRVPRLDVAASGAGDTMAALFLHHYLATSRADLAMARAAAALHAILTKTAELAAPDLALVAAGDQIAHPSLTLVPEGIRSPASALIVPRLSP